jgi:hypothetical protein
MAAQRHAQRLVDTNPVGEWGEGVASPNAMLRVHMCAALYSGRADHTALSSAARMMQTLGLQNVHLVRLSVTNRTLWAQLWPWTYEMTRGRRLLCRECGRDCSKTRAIVQRARTPMHRRCYRCLHKCARIAKSQELFGSQIVMGLPNAQVDPNVLGPKLGVPFDVPGGRVPLIELLMCYQEECMCRALDRWDRQATQPLDDGDTGSVYYDVTALRAVFCTPEKRGDCRSCK